MSIFAIILGIAQVAAAEPVHAERWATYEDYPRLALERSHGGYAGSRLIVSSDGKPIRCEIIYSTGYSELDEITCKLSMQRARFVPARDASGSASVAVFQSTMRWWVEGMQQMNAKPQVADLVLTVNRLPNGMANPAMATVAFAVSPSGEISNCVPMLPQPSASPRSNNGVIEQRVVDLLGRIACLQTQASTRD
jgi:TonB family protein